MKNKASFQWYVFLFITGSLAVIGGRSTPVFEGVDDVFATGGEFEKNGTMKPIEPRFVKRVIAKDIEGITAMTVDFNGDGLKDVVSAQSRGTNVLLMLAPEFRSQVIASHAKTIHGEVCDVDRDGDLDIVLCRFQPGIIYWLEQVKGEQSSKSWAVHEIDSDVNYVHGLMVADVDRDGEDDLIATAGDQDSLYWYVRPANPRSSESWERIPLANRDAPRLVRYVGFQTSIVDIDGDGDQDLLVAGQYSKNIVIYENRPYVE